MDFVDATLLRLADSTTRASAFDDDALASVAAASYDVTAFGLTAPYAGIYDEFELGLGITWPVVGNGFWINPNTSARTEARFEITGLVQSTIRVDALWTGSIAAQVTIAKSAVESVASHWANAGAIDAEIISALGSLPANPATRENERRTRYLTNLRAGFDQPALLTDDMFDASLRLAGVASVGEIIEQNGAGFGTGAFKLVMNVSQPREPSSRQLPVKTAIFIRDAQTAIVDLLHDSKIALAYMRDFGIVPPDAGLPVVGMPSVLWILPASVFDDAGWPGADNATRRSRAAAWLAPQNIALAALPVASIP